MAGLPGGTKEDDRKQQSLGEQFINQLNPKTGNKSLIAGPDTFFGPGRDAPNPLEPYNDQPHPEQPPPGIGVLMPHPPLDLGEAQKAIDNAICKDVNCGEAGCVVTNITMRTTMCLCVPELTQADSNLRCNRSISRPIDPLNPILSPQPPPVFPPHPGPDEKGGTNGTSAMPYVNQSESSDIPINMVHIVVPVVSAVLVIVSIFTVLLLRKRRDGGSRMPKTESPITWLHRQDSALLLEHMTVLSKNPNYYTPDIDGALLASIPASQIPRDRLRLLDEIGEGAFGKVYKGELIWSDDHLTKVAVKILKEDVSHESKEDFKREVEIMSSFDHENILKLIGIVPMETESPYMVFEYMEYGDLTEVLRRNDPAITSKVPIQLKPTDLIDIARQVANGMRYFASRHFVHRDLATRNCLVGSALVVKIADFGMARDIYTCDYYKIGGSRMLPVRWMAPESIKYGRYTTESDVWAYGVVLWEIFTYGKQPYYGHSNEEVIRYIEEGILLQKPPDANDLIYQVMLGCWQRDPKERFNFERVYKHLEDYDNKLSEKVLPPLPVDNIIQIEEV